MTDHSKLRAIAPDRLPRLYDLAPEMGPDSDITFQLPKPLFGWVADSWDGGGEPPREELRSAILAEGGEIYLWSNRGACYGFPLSTYREAFCAVERLRKEYKHYPPALITGFHIFAEVLSNPAKYVGTDQLLRALWQGVKYTDFDFARYLLRYTEVDPTVKSSR